MEHNDKQFLEIAEILKTMAHPVRLCIIKGLLELGECNVSHMQNCMESPQSTVSQHLQKLRMAGIIEGRRNGLEVYYKVCDSRVRDLFTILFQMEKSS